MFDDNEGHINVANDSILKFIDIAQKHGVDYEVSDSVGGTSVISFDASDTSSMQEVFNEFLADELGLSVDDIQNIPDNEMQRRIMGLDPEQFDVTRMSQEEVEDFIATSFLADKCNVDPEVFRNPENAEQAHKLIADLTGVSVEDVENWTQDEILDFVSQTSSPKIATDLAQSGELADGRIQWSISDHGVLSITGEGNIPSMDRYPWNEPLSKILTDEIVVGDGIKNVPPGAFKGFDVTNVQLGKDVELISHNAFAKGSVEKIQFPDGLLLIGDNAFQDCVGLNKVQIPKTVKAIGDMAFAGSGVGGNLKLPTGADIGIGAFNGCKNIQTVEGHYNNISALAFQDTGVKKADLDSCFVDTGAFTLCDNLSELNSHHCQYSKDAVASNLDKVTLDGDYVAFDGITGIFMGEGENREFVFDPEIDTKNSDVYNFSEHGISVNPEFQNVDAEIGEHRADLTEFQNAYNGITFDEENKIHFNEHANEYSGEHSNENRFVSHMDIQDEPLEKVESDSKLWSWADLFKRPDVKGVSQEESRQTESVSAETIHEDQSNLLNYDFSDPRETRPTLFGENGKDGRFKKFEQDADELAKKLLPEGLENSHVKHEKIEH